MSKSNYAVLEVNKKQTLDFAAKIAEKPKPSIPIDTSSKLQSAKDALAKGDFSKSVMLLDEIKDNKLGIKWEESNDLGNGTKSRVRDARNVTTDPDILKSEQGEKYAMQVISEVQAGIAFLDKNVIINDDKREEAKQKLMYIAKKALDEVDSLASGTIEKYNTQIVSSMEKAGISDAFIKLDFAKGLSTFQHEHMHITTLSNVKDNHNLEYTVVEAEIMLNGLTPKLKQQYEAIRDSKIGSEVKIEGVNMDWYNKLPQYKKELVHEVSGKIATGQYVIPTPMLSILPGVRNGYDKVTAIKSLKDGKLVIVNDNLHCGAPASGAKVTDQAGKQEIADLNVEHLQSFSKDGKVNLNVLNSGVLGADSVNEGYIFVQLKNTTAGSKAKGGNVNFSASPINDWRKAPGGGRDHAEFKKSLEEIGKDLKQTGGIELKNVSAYLQNGNKLGRAAESATKVLEELEKLTDRELARVLKAAVETRSLIDTPVALEKSNINLAVTNKMSIVETNLKDPTSSLHNITSDTTKSNLYARVDFCKSGKDRTGYVETKNTNEAVANYLGIDSSSKLGKENLLSQVAAGHTQEMAGIQGGTLGCHGIKQSFVFNLIKDDKGVDGILNQKTANYNEIKMVDPKQISTVSKEFEQEFATYKNTLASSSTPSIPSKSNYDKLQENRKAVLDFAAKVPEHNSVINTEQLLADAKNNLKNGKFEDALQKLDQLKDAKLGIKWSESGDLGHGSRALVRDARNVTLDPQNLQHDAGEKYAMQLLNEVRAGISLLDKLGISEPQKSEAKQKLLFTAEQALDHINSNNLPELSAQNVIEFNTMIVDTLDKAGVKNSAVELNFAKEMTNFKDEHRHIVTLTSALDSKGGKHTVMEAEIMLNGLTQNQKKQYEVIAKSTPGQKFSGDEMAWYNEMPRHRQDMLREVASDIATGNKIIPTQLLGSIIGIRNGYEKVTAVQGSGEQSPTIVSQTLHCGAPATKIKIPGDDLPKEEAKNREKTQKNAIVQENVEQLQSFIEPGKRMNLNNLTSRTPGNARGEDFIFDQLENVKNPKVSVGSSPINKWRALGGGRDQKEFDKTLQDIGKDLQNNKSTKGVANFLQNGKSKKSAMRDIEKLETSDPKLASILKVAVSSKKLLDQSTNLSSSENINLEVASKMNLIDNSLKLGGGALNKVTSAQTKQDHATRVDFCKSGKDRTGLLEMKNTQLAVANHLGVDPDSPLGKGNMTRQVAGGHTQEMAGVQGGTIGCHSIKTNPEFGLNKSDKVINGVINQKSSSFNSKIKVVEEKKKEAVLGKFEVEYKSYQTKKQVVAATKEQSNVDVAKAESKQETSQSKTAEYQYPPKATTIKMEKHRKLFPTTVTKQLEKVIHNLQAKLTKNKMTTKKPKTIDQTKKPEGQIGH